MRKFYKTQPFSPGQKVTIIGIGGLAMTYRRQVIVQSVVDEPQPMGRDSKRYGTYKEPRKRKAYYLDIGRESLVFDGHDKPFLIDSEAFSRFCGNALLNLVGEPEEIKRLIDTETLLPVDDETKARVVVAKPDADQSIASDPDDGKIVLYPDLALTRGHAVMQDILERQGITREAFAT